MTTFQSVSSPRFAKMDLKIRGDGTEEDLGKLYSRFLQKQRETIQGWIIGDLLDAAWRALEKGRLETCEAYWVLVNHS